MVISWNFKKQNYLIYYWEVFTNLSYSWRWFFYFSMVVFIMIAIFSYGLSLCTGSGKGAVKISKMIVKIKKIDRQQNFKKHDQRPQRMKSETCILVAQCTRYPLCFIYWVHYPSIGFSVINLHNILYHFQHLLRRRKAFSYGFFLTTLRVSLARICDMW